MSERREIVNFIKTLTDLNIVNSTDETTWKRYIDTLVKAWNEGEVKDVKECASRMLVFKPAKNELRGQTLTGLQHIANGEWVPDRKARPTSDIFRSKDETALKEKSKKASAELKGVLSECDIHMSDKQHEVVRKLNEVQRVLEDVQSVFPEDDAVDGTKLAKAKTGPPKDDPIFTAESILTQALDIQHREQTRASTLVGTLNEVQRILEEVHAFCPQGDAVDGARLPKDYLQKDPVGITQVALNQAKDILLALRREQERCEWYIEPADSLMKHDLHQTIEPAPSQGNFQRSSTEMSESMRKEKTEKDKLEQNIQEMQIRHAELTKREYRENKRRKFDRESQSTDELSVIIKDMKQELHTIMHLQCSRDEARQLARDYRTLETRLKTYEDKVAYLEVKNEDLLSRLSQVVSAKLLNNNPDTADLCNANRPTKLAEQYSELYDNAWTDAFDILTKEVKTPDPKAISILLGYLTKTVVYTGNSYVVKSICQEYTGAISYVFWKIMQSTIKTRHVLRNSSYTHCLRYSEMQELLMEGLILSTATVTSQIEQSASRVYEARLREKIDMLIGKLGDDDQKMLNNLRKQTRLLSVQDVIKAGMPALLKDQREEAVRKYVTECLHLCWLMCQKQPQVYIDVEVTQYKGSFDKSLYREYMKKGKNVDYVVWPTLYLQKGGNLLAKGVANGK